MVKRARLPDGGYVEIVPADDGWTYSIVPESPTGTPKWGGPAPGFHRTEAEAIAEVRNRFVGELEFVED